MTVELRFVPPPKSEDDNTDTSETDQDEADLYSDLDKIKQALMFPEIEGEPVSELPPPDPPKSRRNKAGS